MKAPCTSRSPRTDPAAIQGFVAGRPAPTPATWASSGSASRPAPRPAGRSSTTRLPTAAMGSSRPPWWDPNRRRHPGPPDPQGDDQSQAAQPGGRLAGAPPGGHGGVLGHCHPCQRVRFVLALTGNETGPYAQLLGEDRDPRDGFTLVSSGAPPSDGLSAHLTSRPSAQAARPTRPSVSPTNSPERRPAPQ